MHCQRIEYHKIIQFSISLYFTDFFNDSKSNSLLPHTNNSNSCEFDHMSTGKKKKSKENKLQSKKTTETIKEAYKPKQHRG